MATNRQKKLAAKIVESASQSRPMNKRDLLVSVGYDIQTATQNAKPVIEAKGTQEELVKLGFTPYNAKRVVSEIMLNPEAENRDRLKAADMALNVFGEYAPDKSISMSVSAKDLQEAITKDMARFRGSTKP